MVLVDEFNVPAPAARTYGMAGGIAGPQHTPLHCVEDQPYYGGYSGQFGQFTIKLIMLE